MCGDAIGKILQARTGQSVPERPIEAISSRAQRYYVTAFDVHSGTKRLNSKAHRSAKIGEKPRAALPVKPHFVVASAALEDIFMDSEREADSMAQERKRQWPRNANRRFRAAGLRPAEILRSIFFRDREGALRKGGN
jgi:hypothetical protein